MQNVSYQPLLSRALAMIVAADMLCALSPAWALAPGEDGVVVTLPVSGISDIAQAAVVDPDGGVVLAGTSGGNTTVLARITSSGVIDAGFGASGYSVPNFSGATGGDGLRALVRMPDNSGRYIGCGVYGSNVTGNDFFIARFLSDGSLDTSFNGVGYVVTSFNSGSSEQCNAVAIQSDGMIVSAGLTQSGHLHVALTRHTADGVPDAMFGTAGKVQIDASAGLNGDSEARALVLQPNGDLLIAGYALGSSNIDFMVMRLKPADGSPDPNFGTSGITRTPIGTSEDIANAMVLQPNGAIVLAGSSYGADGHRHFALARYSQFGVLDTSFNGTGKVTTNVGPSDDYAYALLLMPWGRLVAGGNSRVNTSSSETDVAVAAYNADGTLDRFFGTAGKRTVNVSQLEDTAYALVSDLSGERFWAVGTAAAGLSPNQDFLAIDFGLPDTIFRHGFETSTAP